MAGQATAPLRLTQRLLGCALGFYVVSVLVGLGLRMELVRPLGLFSSFGNALHAHSHTLYFGWLGLVIVALAYRAVGASARATRWAGASLSVVTAAGFISFLHGGYWVPSVVLSTLSLCVWGGITWGFFRAARGQDGLWLSFLRTGFAYIGLAALGATGRVVLLATGANAPLEGRLAVFAFLHCFGWFFAFCAMGLLLHHLQGLGVKVRETGLRRTLPLLGATAWLGFPLGVAGGAEGAVGIAARVGVFVTAVAAITWAQALFGAARAVRAGPDKALRMALWLTATWLVAKLVMEAVGASGLVPHAAALRHPVILYLHVELVGFITCALFIPLLSALRRPFGAGLWLHSGGLAVMALGLGLLTGALLGVPGLAATFRPALWLAAAGGAGIVLAGVVYLLPLRRAAPEAGPLRAGVARVSEQR